MEISMPNNIHLRYSIIILYVLLVIGCSESVGFENSTAPELPLNIPDKKIKALRKLVDKNLQNRFEKQLRQNKTWNTLIKKKKMAVGLVDLSNVNAVKYAHVNGDVMMYAASLPKLAILLAAFQSFEDGILKETPEILHDLQFMISVSDNEAATRMIDRLGFQRIETVLRDPRYNLYELSSGGGLWVGKRYAMSGKRYPDPLMNLSHGATVTQVSRFYYLLAMGKLVSRERSKQMLDILVDPELHHKFVKILDEVAPDADIYRKSGTWKNWHSDSVLVWGPIWRRYIVVALLEDPNGKQICQDLIIVIEKILQSQLTLQISNN